MKGLSLVRSCLCLLVTSYYVVTAKQQTSSSWILSASSPLQQRLIHHETAASKKYTALFVRGGALKASPPAKQAAPKTTTEGASIPNEVFNLVKAIVGVGVLSLPSGVAAFADAKSAVLPAVSLITVIGILSGYGFALIGKVCAYTGAKSYREAWAKSVGPSTAWIPAWSATLKTSLACLAFSMVLGDTFSSLLGTQRIPTLVGMTTLILLPLCLMKNLKSLAPFSLLGVMGMGYTALAMTVRWLDGSYDVVNTAEGLHMSQGSLVADVDTRLWPIFGSNGGFKSAMSPSSLILLCMLSTAFMVSECAHNFLLLSLLSSALLIDHSILLSSYFSLGPLQCSQVLSGIERQYYKAFQYGRIFELRDIYSTYGVYHHGRILDFWKELLRSHSQQLLYKRSLDCGQPRGGSCILSVLLSTRVCRHERRYPGFVQSAF